MTAVSLDDLKRRLGYLSDQTQDDVDLTDALAAAVEVVEALVGPISPRTVTETVTSTNGSALLDVFPVVSVSTTDVVLGKGGTVTGLPYGASTVTYVAGREATASQREAVYLVAKDLWETRNGPAARDDVGQYVITPILHRRVRELLAATLLGPSIA